MAIVDSGTQMLFDSVGSLVKLNRVAESRERPAKETNQKN
jgi:hypothetical protein